MFNVCMIPTLNKNPYRESYSTYSTKELYMTMTKSYLQS